MLSMAISRTLAAPSEIATASLRNEQGEALALRGLERLGVVYARDRTLRDGHHDGACDNGARKRAILPVKQLYDNLDPL